VGERREAGSEQKSNSPLVNRIDRTISPKSAGLRGPPFAFRSLYSSAAARAGEFHGKRKKFPALREFCPPRGDPAMMWSAIVPA
jgi:hypothetical protein